ncbi:MAG: hypothetical protein U0X20_07405 [Caldilineaceae bacterium]
MLDKLERYAERSAIDWKRLNRDAEKYMDLVGLGLPCRIVGGLSAAQKQLIMIARSLSSNAPAS